MRAILVDDSPANIDAFKKMGGRVISAENKTPMEWMPELSAMLEN